MPSSKPPPATSSAVEWQKVHGKSKQIPCNYQATEHIRLENRFEALANVEPHQQLTKCNFCQYIAKDSEDLELHVVTSCKSVGERTPYKNAPQNQKREEARTKQRPQLSQHKEENIMPIRPGFKSYAKASTNVKSISD